MCFSFEVSLGTFAAVWGICIYLLKTRKFNKIEKQNVIFLMIVTSMQLVDAVFWYIKMEKNRINFFVTSYVLPALLSMQVFYNILIINQFYNPYAYLFLVVFTIYLFVRFRGYSVSLCENKLSSPVWADNEIHYWEMVLFAVVILYPSFSSIFLLLFVIVPLIKIFVGGAYGSLWCAIVSLYAIKYLFYGPSSTL